MIKSKDETIDIMIRAVNSMAALIDESVGVTGLHQNGDIATWAELRRGGRFEGWLSDVDDALDEVARLESETKQASDQASRDDGGPAFPHGPLGSSFTGPDGFTTHQTNAGAGMSLRDWFAGNAEHDDIMALAGACNERAPETVEGVAMALAKLRYVFADAMLKARGQ